MIESHIQYLLVSLVFLSYKKMNEIFYFFLYYDFLEYMK